MIFSFCDEAGSPSLRLRGELFKYLIKVRRHKNGDMIPMRRAAEPQTLYIYRVEDIDGREATLELEEERILHVSASRKLHIGWCNIDPKSVEKVLPMLNEAGVERITFVTCKRSQKGFQPDINRLVRILEASSQQCGRSEPMQLETMGSIADFLNAYPDAKVLDFGGEIISAQEPLEVVLIGCEGGFDKDEKALFSGRTIRFETPMVLRSESAAVAIANKFLL